MKKLIEKIENVGGTLLLAYLEKLDKREKLIEELIDRRHLLLTEVYHPLEECDRTSISNNNLSLVKGL